LRLEDKGPSVTFPLCSTKALAICSAARTNPPGGVKNQINRLIFGREPDRAEHGLRILDVDITAYRNAQQADGLLAMNHRDHPGLPLVLKTGEESCSSQVRPIRATRLLNENEGKDHPDKPLSTSSKTTHLLGRAHFSSGHFVSQPCSSPSP
jgi:hypothetical protein